MTIFQLIVYSCVTANGLDGELLAKTCRWDTRDLYAKTDRCEEAGAAILMLQFEVLSGLYEDRRVEKHKCIKVWVND